VSLANRCLPLAKLKTPAQKQFFVLQLQELVLAIAGRFTLVEYRPLKALVERKQCNLKLLSGTVLHQLRTVLLASPQLALLAKAPSQLWEAMQLCLLAPILDHWMFKMLSVPHIVTMLSVILLLARLLHVIVQ
jgi:hypothetical protein